MKEFLGHGIDEVAAALYMLPKTILRYLSKCLNSGEVKAETLGQPLNSFLMHLHVEFVMMEAVLDHPEKTLSEIAENIFDMQSIFSAEYTIGMLWELPATKD